VQIVRVALTVPGGGPAGRSDAELVGDLLWSHCPPGAGVAHITTAAHGDQIDVTVFLNPAPENPASRVMALLSLIPPNSTALSYWLDPAADVHTAMEVPDDA